MNDLSKMLVDYGQFFKAFSETVTNDTNEVGSQAWRERQLAYMNYLKYLNEYYSKAFAYPEETKNMFHRDYTGGIERNSIWDDEKSVWDDEGTFSYKRSERFGDGVSDFFIIISVIFGLIIIVKACSHYKKWGEENGVQSVSNSEEGIPCEHPAVIPIEATHMPVEPRSLPVEPLTYFQPATSLSVQSSTAICIEPPIDKPPSYDDVVGNTLTPPPDIKEALKSCTTTKKLLRQESAPDGQLLTASENTDDKNNYAKTTSAEF